MKNKRKPALLMVPVICMTVGYWPLAPGATSDQFHGVMEIIG